MDNYSLESSANKIFDSKVKEYFKEVSSSYYNHNHRAAIVTLYSVVIVDILLKLEYLQNHYNDSNAQSILNKINQQRSKDPYSGRWESDLIEEIKKRNILFDTIQINFIEHLQEQRHLTAHPVISSHNDILYTPNRETAASIIRNILEGVLVVAPLNSKEIIDIIIKDIAESKYLYNSNSKFSHYLNSKYFKNLSDSLRIKLFQTLWKFVTYKDNTECRQNIPANFWAIQGLYNNYSMLIQLEIKSNISTYSVINLNYKLGLNYHIFLFNIIPDIANMLPQASVSILAELRRKDINLLGISIFSSLSYNAHCQLLIQYAKEGEYMGGVSYLKTDNIKYLYKYGCSINFKTEATNFVIDYFETSNTFEISARIYNEIICLYLDEFNSDSIIKLIEIMNTNDQIYSSYKVRKNLGRVLSVIQQRNITKFNIVNYPKIFV